jgi:peptidoglycan/LPS O-acetylase OafA/YrhL
MPDASTAVRTVPRAVSGARLAPGRDAASHMPQLDALRAIAVSAVVVHHFLPGGAGAAADAGVKLFFTLSGFLITSGLLRTRATITAGDQTLPAAIARFYARRSLRIFPLYYFVIAIALLIGLPPAREIVWWLVTYTLNILMARQGWFEANFAHFWSLAVEEQFYVFWPWLVLVLPARLLIPGAVVMTLIAPAYRLSYALSDYQNMTGLSSYISTWSCLDSLGTGALLAMLQRALPAQVVDRWLLRRLLPAGLLGYLLFSLPVTSSVGFVLFGVAQAVVFAAAIRLAAVGVGGRGRRVLEYGPLMYLGRISYGVYVYHPFMKEGARWTLLRADPSTPAEGWLVILLALVATLVVSSLSWALLEAPINRLKRHVRDPLPTATRESAAGRDHR